MIGVDPDGELYVDSQTGKPLFKPVGNPVKTSHKADPNGNMMQPGYIFTNNGKPVHALMNTTSDQKWDTDCHGYTFTSGELWINNKEVPDIIYGDFMSESKTPKVNDIVIYYTDKKNSQTVEHSMTISRIDAKTNDIYVTGLGGLETNAKEVLITDWSNEYIIYEQPQNIDADPTLQKSLFQQIP